MIFPSASTFAVSQASLYAAMIDMPFPTVVIS